MMGSGPSVARDVSLRRFSSLGIGGFAAGAVTVEDEKTLERVLASADSSGVPVKILGGGTNVVFTDHGFAGLIVRLGDGFKKIDIQPSRVTAGAAVHLTALITRTMEAGLSGVEKLAGIPGTLGGAVYQNSGARDYDTSHAIAAVTFWDMDQKKMRTLPRDQLKFGYRTSCFHQMPAVILSAELALEPARREDLMAEVNARMKYRTASQPSGRSVGCIFKNAGERSAGQLIDEAGLKGRRVGGLVVSDVHGNFFLNDGRATFKEFEELVSTVQSSVKNKFGVLLELEVEVVREISTTADNKGTQTGKTGEPFRENTENRPLRGWKISGEGNFI